MNTDTLRFIATKPNCFALPNEFDWEKAKCESCHCQEECGEIADKYLAIRIKAHIEGLQEGYASALDELTAQGKAARISTEDQAPINKAKGSAIQAAEELTRDASPNEPAGTMVGPAISHGPVSVTSDPSPATAVKVDTEEAKDAKPGEYSFPLHRGRPYESNTNEQLVSRLTALLHAGFEAQPPRGYSAVREEICAIHIEANLRQEHAPRFRPMQRLEKEAVTQDQINAARDRQVIDIHWRAHSQNKPYSPVNNYPTIFNDEPFDLAAAEKFAQEEWRASAKAVHLHLSDQMQWEHSIIQEPNIRDKWRTISFGDIRGSIVKEAGAPQIEKRLREAVFQENNRQVEISIPGMVDAWKARQIVRRGLVKITDMIALMTGNKARDPRAVSRTLDSLDRLLGAPTKPVKKKSRNSTAKVIKSDTKGSS